jgi:hypothetical protein
MVLKLGQYFLKGAQYFKFYLAQYISEVGKGTLKSNSDEAFNAEKKL